MIRTQEYERINYTEEYAPRIGTAFDEAWGFFHVGLEIIDAIKNSASPCEPLTKCVLLSNSVDSVLRYRSIIGLCEIGQSESAEILTRSLFEVLLAQRCILKPPVGQIGLLSIPANETAVDFMAKVYFHAAALKHEKALKRINELGHSKGEITPVLRQLTQESGDTARAEIGQQWADKAAGGTTFIGGGVEDLARVFGHQADYDSFYRGQCRPTHANESLSRMCAEAEHGNTIIIDFNAKPETIRKTLLVGAGWTALLLVYTREFFTVPIPDKLADTLMKAGFGQKNPEG